MRFVLQRRPSPSMIVSLVALVVALSGTAVAGVRLVNGNRLIRRGSLSANRLRKHSISRRQINLRKLGTVPRAKSAGSATLAGHATTSVYAVKAQSAVSADSATTAGNASALGGQPASSFLTTGARIGTNGVVSLTGSPSGTTVSLFTHGPFSVSMTCQTIGSDTKVSLSVSSSESGADLGYGWPDVSADTPEVLEHVGPEPVADSYNPLPIALEAPSGAQLIATGAIGINDVSGPGTCWANFAGIA